MNCECLHNTCPCATNPGPALFLIKRDNKELNLCTKCVLSSDEKVRFLTENPMSAEEILNYDPLGWLCAVLSEDQERLIPSELYMEIVNNE